MKRRSFVGALAALVAVPKALVALEPRKLFIQKSSAVGKTETIATTRYPWGDTPVPSAWYDANVNFASLKDGDQVTHITDLAEGDLPAALFTESPEVPRVYVDATPHRPNEFILFGHTLNDDERARVNKYLLRPRKK